MATLEAAQSRRTQMFRTAVAMAVFSWAGLVGTPIALGGTITSITGPIIGNTGSCGCQGGAEVALSFTLSESLADVDILADLYRTTNSGVTTGTIYLTNAIGPGTTNANVLATIDASTLPIDPSHSLVPFPLDELFGGLSLQAGTYYVVALALTGEINADITGTPTTFNSAFGSAGSQYLGSSDVTFGPAASFSAIGAKIPFEVDAVPEPNTLSLLLASGLLLCSGVASARHRRQAPPGKSIPLCPVARLDAPRKS